MRRSVYIETTVVSLLTARPVRDAILAGKMAATRHWWSAVLPRVEACCSVAVIAESSAGDPVAASLRLDALEGLRVLGVSDTAHQLADTLVRRAALPAKARVDALHVAVSAIHKIDFLLTWNCTHIANPSLQKRIRLIIEESGYDAPTICTPMELTEDTV